jgi:hypothetical protein
MITPKKSSAVVALLMLLCISFMAQGGQHLERVIYVGQEGDDNHDGRFESPVFTLHRASDLARSFLWEHARDTADIEVTMVLMGGTFRISDPWEFRSSEWPRRPFTLTIRSLAGKQSIVSGGWPIPHWVRRDDGLFKASLAEYPGDLTGVRELFVGQHRATRARYPDDDFLRIESSGKDRRTSFSFHEGDLNPIPDLDHCELVFFHDWSTSRVGVKAVDFTRRVLTVTDPIGPNAPHFAIDNFERHPRYYLEHSRSFINGPGEWYLDRKEKELLYMPCDGETTEDLDAVIPLASQLIRVIGTPEKPFQNVNIKGLILEHTSWPIPANGYAAGQATYHERRFGEGGALRELIPAAVEMQFVQNCSFEGNELRHVGTSGLHLGAWSINNRITYNHLHHVAGNGIMIGEDYSRHIDGKTWWQAAPDQISSRNKIAENLVEECGNQFFGAVGIWVGFARETRLERNTIRHLPYTGISLGWMWSPVPTPVEGNLILENRIHHVMQVLSDGGGIYTLGRQPNSRIEGNVIHDVPLNLGRAESNGMFLDEGTTGFTVKGNLIYNIDRSPLRFHRASTNVVESNLLYVSGKEIPPVRYNNTPEEMILLKTNEVILQSAKRLESSKDQP